MTSKIALSAHGIFKTYATSPPVHALRGADFTAFTGERIAIVGRSGAGKSTLLNILGLLDYPTAGSYSLLGHETTDTRNARRDELRARSLGFVFQESHALAHRTVWDNVELKLAVLRVPRRSRPTLVTDVLARVGLLSHAYAEARLLSGGEKQRLAIARAVISRPAVLLADEPTGNLDKENADGILSIFDEQAARGVAVIVITHDPRLAAWADRTLVLEGGILHADG